MFASVSANISEPKHIKRHGQLISELDLFSTGSLHTTEDALVMGDISSFRRGMMRKLMLALAATTAIAIWSTFAAAEASAFGHGGAHGGFGGFHGGFHGHFFGPGIGFYDYPHSYDYD